MNNNKGDKSLLQHNATKPVENEVSYEELCALNSALQQQLEEAQQRNNALEVRLSELETTLNAMPVGVAITNDPKGRLIRFNPAACQMLEIPVERGQQGIVFGDEPISFHVIRYGQDVTTQEMALQRAIRTGKPVWGSETTLIFADGRRADLRTNAVPLLDAQQRVCGGVTCFIDVTSSNKAVRELKKASLHKDEFITTLSHELRNPLASVRYSLYLLQSGEASENATQEALEVMERQVGFISRMVDDLLDISRVSRGKVTLRWRRLDMVELVQQAVEDHRGRLKGSGEERLLKIELPSQALCVRGDPTRLTQIVGNILHNAIKFTSLGDTITVEVQGTSQDEYFSVTIRDTGMGMAPKTVEHVFDPFIQGSQAIEHQTGGLGLGLALVKKLVELHGGRINAHSAGLGKGSQFTIMLPLDTGPITFDGEERQAPVEKSRRVLLIEDNHDTAGMMRRMLEYLGHSVAVAYDGESALQTAARFRPEVVLCDIGLPGDMTGFDVAKHLCQTHTNALLIALSGYSTDKDRQHSLDAGFHHFLTKPADPDALHALIVASPSQT